VPSFTEASDARCRMEPVQDLPRRVLLVHGCFMLFVRSSLERPAGERAAWRRNAHISFFYAHIRPARRPRPRENPFFFFDRP
jgi:hypothetical protein